MKVIIDIIEDIRSAINNDRSFALRAMGLQEGENAEFTPLWQSEICSYKLDSEAKKLYLFLGKDEGLNVGDFLDYLQGLKNDEMMHEVCVSYSKEQRRLDESLLGFGESFKDKKYLLFIEA